MRKKQRSTAARHQDTVSKGNQGRQKPYQKGPKPATNEPKNNRQPQNSKSSFSLPRDSVLAWGRHAVFAALKNPARSIVSVYAAPDMADEVRGVMDDHPSAKKRPELITMGKPELSDTMARYLPADEKAVHQGLVAVMRPLNTPTLDEWLDDGPLDNTGDETGEDRCLVILLDQITDARNIGAIMRSARAFHASAIITTDKHCPPETGVMLRTASGAAEYIPLIKVVNLSRSIEKLQDHGFTVAGMTAAGKTPIRQLSDYDRLGIVMGAEGKGLRRLTEEHADLLVSIPIDEDAESLNVSNAAAVALFAAQR